MSKLLKVFDSSEGKMDLEDTVNEWLAQNEHIEIISTNLTWDESNLVYTVLYSKAGLELNPQ